MSKDIEFIWTDVEGNEIDSCKYTAGAGYKIIVEVKSREMYGFMATEMPRLKKRLKEFIEGERGFMVICPPSHEDLKFHIIEIPEEEAVTRE